MAKDSLNCWHCGGDLSGLPLPLGRREECPACASSLHVCRMCEFYELGANRNCREPMAGEVREKEAGNYCDYFRPRLGLNASEDRAAAESRARLSALFGEDAGKERPDLPAAPSDSPEAEESRRKLESLFGGSEK